MFRVETLILILLLPTTALGEAGAQESLAYRKIDALLQLDPPSVTLGDNRKEGPAQFGVIRGVTLDRALNIYVLDESDHTVRVFSATSRYLGALGGVGD